MRILALETSGLAGSVAALDGDISAEIELDASRRTAQTLAPAMDEILGRMGWQPNQVQLVAVTQGPGSFTGLRIGVTTAKTFAYATGAAIVGVNTLAAIASQATPAEGLLWAVMNAERDQLFAASFQWQNTMWAEMTGTSIQDCETWLQSLNGRVQVTGPGLRNLMQRLPDGVHPLQENVWSPRATSVALEGLRLFKAGRQSDCWSLLPNYFRESAAVEKARKS